MHCKLSYKLVYKWFYIQPISLKVQEGNVIWHKNIKNVKIPSYPSIYENVYKLQKKFLVRVFWLKYIFRFKFKIPVLDLMLLPKNSVPFEGLYSTTCKVSVF